MEDGDMVPFGPVWGGKTSRIENWRSAKNGGVASRRHPVSLPLDQHPHLESLSTLFGPSLMTTWKRGLAVLILAGVAAGCGSESQLAGTPVPNSAPNTEVTGTPPVLGQTTFKVEFFWKGSDDDGQVVGFEWRISNNGADGVVDPPDTLAADLPWTFTAATDSVFTVSADIDSFDVDVSDPNQDPSTYRFWQTHTFFIRSVDDEGARDPSPANVSFTATTIAPNIRIDLPEPRASVTCVSSAKVLTFGWVSEDPDSIEGDPEAVRYLLMPVRTDPDDGCIIQIEYESANPALIQNDNPLWSDWIPYEAASDSGRIVTLPRQEANNRYLFAVQARDLAGAVTPTFEWNRNVRHVETSNGKFPVLELCEKFLGCNQFVGRNGLKSFEIVSGQPLEFSWTGDAAEYAGIIEAFRYGWNVLDPDDEDDPGWQVEWGSGPNWTRALTRSFAQGSPNFVVQCRDNSGTISRATIQFQVIQAPPRVEQRNLLLIDDVALESSPDLEALWDNSWNEIVSGRVQGFQPSDILDAIDQAKRISFATISEYKSVIWFINTSESSFFHTRFAPQGRTEPRYNWLEIYQAQVGNLLICGPGAAITSLERPSTGSDWVFPLYFNVSALPPLGFGTVLRGDGTRVNVGISRWPYSAWCMEALDTMRPALGQVFGETPGNAFRSKKCDSMARAIVAEEFRAKFPDSVGSVDDLEPNMPRTNFDSRYKFEFEEFYNANTTRRNTAISVRDCQTPMFNMETRRAAGWVPDADLVCLPSESEASALEGTTVGLVSSKYSETKQLVGSSDFIWGFHPLGFDLGRVTSTVLWIMGSNWQIDVNR